MTQISVLYFAGLRDLLGLEEETLALDEQTDVASLRAALLTRYPKLEGHMDSVRFALNEEFASDGDPISDGDTVALIPPVSGG